MRSMSLFLASAVVSGALPSRVEAAEPRYSPIEVATNFEDENPERTKRIQPRLEQGTVEALRLRHGIEVVDSADTELVVFVRSLAEESDSGPQLAVIDYAVLVEVRIGGEQVVKEPFFCAKKGEAELIACVVDGLAPVLQDLPTEETADPPETTPVAEGDGGHSGEEPIRVTPIGPMGVTGIVLGVGGIATAIAGGVDLGRGEVLEDEPPQSGVDLYVDHRPRGRTLLGVGAGFLVVGAVLVGVDVGLRARKRKQPAVQVGVDAGRAFTGLTLRGRF